MFTHKMWNDDELSKMVEAGVPFPMLSDAGGKVGTVYGVYDEDNGVEARGRFIPGVNLTRLERMLWKVERGELLTSYR